jgi:hypothetical protein
MFPDTNDLESSYTGCDEPIKVSRLSDELDDINEDAQLPKKKTKKTVKKARLLSNKPIIQDRTTRPLNVLLSRLSQDHSESRTDLSDSHKYTPLPVLNFSQLYVPKSKKKHQMEKYLCQKPTMTVVEKKLRKIAKQTKVSLIAQPGLSHTTVTKASMIQNDLYTKPILRAQVEQFPITVVEKLRQIQENRLSHNTSNVNSSPAEHAYVPCGGETPTPKLQCSGQSKCHFTDQVQLFT